jgi:hypothetical protein
MRLSSPRSKEKRGENVSVLERGMMHYGSSAQCGGESPELTFLNDDPEQIASNWENERTIENHHLEFSSKKNRPSG